jgi:hypothetical protein
MICKQKGNYESFENPMDKTQSNCIPAYHKNSLKPNKKNKEKFHNIQFLMLLESKFFVKGRSSLCVTMCHQARSISHNFIVFILFSDENPFISHKKYTRGVLAIKPKTHPFYKSEVASFHLSIESTGYEFSSIIHLDRLNPMFRIICLQLNKLGHYFSKDIVVCGQKAHMRPSSGDASIKTMKYMNGPDNG